MTVIFFNTLLFVLTINVSEMFRDPSFYRALREKVIPELKKKPFIKLWHAGCASGEEVYSLAIVMKEEGMANQIRVYATDVDESVLATAKKGVYDINRLTGFTMNCRHAGGRGLAVIEKMGGLVAVQAPDTAEIPAMPLAAIAAVQDPVVLPLEQICPFLKALGTIRVTE